MRGKSSSLYKVCNECRKRKLRRSEFHPRWGHCTVHARFEKDCSSCRDLRDGHTRQPRCKDCDRARARRVRRFRALQRVIERTAIEGVTLHRKDAATLVVYLSGNPFPLKLVRQLQDIAQGTLSMKLTRRLSQLEIVFTKSA